MVDHTDLTMSSDDGEPHDLPSKVPQKRRRLQRSCDSCRKRKIRCTPETSSCNCDSANMPDGRCSHCMAFNAECLHTEPVRKRGPKNKHVEELREQLSVLEAKLRTVQPETYPVTSSSNVSVIKYPAPPMDSNPSPPRLPEEDLSHDELSEKFRQFSLASLRHRFFGSSSGFMLVKNALAVKEEYLGRAIEPEFKRPEFWHIRPWEKSLADDDPSYVFPEQDLLNALVNLYFINVHPCLPLLHRPSFERSVAEGLHRSNIRFGGLLLAVLAVASRYSDDPRVFVPGSNSTLSCGWAFFDQVQVIRKSLFDEPSIYEVQLYCLITLYTLGTSSPQASWLYLGLGIRFIQERGEHRRKRDNRKATAENESWKRVFWCLLLFDRTICSFLGRPTAIHVEDYDIELPIEVDDEYWEHPDPEQAFKQPPGKPSMITYFNCHIRLCEILGSTLRRLYASNKSRVLMGLVGTDWEQRAVAELDSAMNEFLGSLPEHLRWDPDRTGIFFDQSATLHSMYYWLQITIHRPYIHKPTILAFPSLAICTSAARSCIHVVDVWLSRMQRVPMPHVQTGVFISAVVLLMNLFGVKRAGLPIDVGKELAHVHTAMRALKFWEARWQTCGRLWELLQKLQSWEGPPPAKKNTEPEAAPPVPVDDDDDDDGYNMCPGRMKVLEEAKTASIFTEATTNIPQGGPASSFLSDELSPPPPLNMPAPQHPEQALLQQKHQEAAALSYGMVVDRDIWSGTPLLTTPAKEGSTEAVTAQQAEVTMEQLLAATAVYDDATGLAKSVDHWSDTTALANMIVDDDLMSMWVAAPTGLGNWDAWDKYIEEKQRSGTGGNWGTNFDPTNSGSILPS